MKSWLRSLIAPSRAEEAHVEEQIEVELSAPPISEEVAQAAGVELARMVLPFFVSALRVQAAEEAEEARQEQTLAALRQAASMTKETTRRS